MLRQIKYLVCRIYSVTNNHLPSFYFLTSPKCAQLTLLTKSTICEHGSVQLISLMTKSIPHQINSTHMFPQVHPPRQTHSFSLTLRPTGQKFFLDKVGEKIPWPGRQGEGRSKARQAGISQISNTVPQPLSRQSRSSGISWGQPHFLHSPDKSAVRRQGQAQARKPSQVRVSQAHSQVQACTQAGH